MNLSERCQRALKLKADLPILSSQEGVGGGSASNINRAVDLPADWAVTGKMRAARID